MRSFIFPTLLISFLGCSSLWSQEWNGISSCGTYQVKGVARSTDQGLVIAVNEKSQSEIIIKVSVQNESFLAPYVDKAMEASVLFEKMSRGPSVEGTIKEIKSRIPNPINPMDTGIKLISKAACK